jgi:hypothetical protein
MCTTRANNEPCYSCSQYCGQQKTNITCKCSTLILNTELVKVTARTRQLVDITMKLWSAENPNTSIDPDT